jgi:predicted GNAT family acetyltransferase
LSTDHRVSREHGATKGRFVIRKGGEEAELTYSITTPTLVIADHTGVPDSFRGTGAGLAPVQALVAAAREDGFKVVPLCPYVNATRKKHPEWADVFI